MTEIAVVAGTLTDSEFGQASLRERGILSDKYELASTSSDYEVILSDPKIAEREVKKILRKTIDSGVKVIFAYCNSLASVVDFERLSKEFDLKIITVFDAYKEFFLTQPELTNVAVLAGNGEGIAGVSRAIYGTVLNASVVGISLLQVVEDIESGLPAERIFRKNRLDELLVYLESHCQTLVLGCTHFPILSESFRNRTLLSIVDPTELMIELSEEALNS